MTTRTLVSAALVVVLTTACDRIPFLGGSSDSTTDSTGAAAGAETAAPTAPAAVPDSAAPDSTPAGAAAEGAAAPETASERAPAPARPQPPANRQAAPTAPMAEEPWTPTQSGTVDPGMSRTQVVEAWGEPVVERLIGEWSFLYYRNGCERRCGTFDVVFLQGNQVVDAVVRTPHHEYSGISSSPPERQAMFTPPSTATPDSLRISG